MSDVDEPTPYYAGTQRACPICGKAGSWEIAGGPLDLYVICEVCGDEHLAISVAFATVEGGQ